MSKTNGLQHLFILWITDKFHQNLLELMDSNINLENSRRVLEKFFLDINPTDTAVSHRTAHHHFLLELSDNWK
jgi:hypothetical protein